MPRKKPKTKDKRPKFPKEIFLCENGEDMFWKYIEEVKRDANDGEYVATYRLVSTARIQRGTTLVDVEEAE